jgi:hypothetical protein
MKKNISRICSIKGRSVICFSDRNSRLFLTQIQIERLQFFSRILTGESDDFRLKALKSRAGTKTYES